MHEYTSLYKYGRSKNQGCGIKLIDVDRADNTNVNDTRKCAHIKFVHFFNT